MIVRRTTISFRLFRFYMTHFNEEPDALPRDLCSFVRVAYLWNLVQLALIVGLYGAGAFMLATTLGNYLIDFLIGVGVIAGIASVIAVAAVLIWSISCLTESTTAQVALKRAGDAIADSVPAQYAVAWKRRICPTITVEG